MLGITYLFPISFPPRASKSLKRSRQRWFQQYIHLDVTDPASESSAMTEIGEATDNRLDCIVNNAGIAHKQVFADLSDDQWNLTNVDLRDDDGRPGRSSCW